MTECNCAAVTSELTKNRTKPLGSWTNRQANFSSLSHSTATAVATGHSHSAAAPRPGTTSNRHPALSASANRLLVCMHWQLVAVVNNRYGRHTPPKSPLVGIPVGGLPTNSGGYFGLKCDFFTLQILGVKSGGIRFVMNTSEISYRVIFVCETGALLADR